MNDRPRQSSLPSPHEEADARIATHIRIHHLCCAVLAVVIDNQNFTIHIPARQCSLHAINEGWNVRRFV